MFDISYKEAKEAALVQFNRYYLDGILRRAGGSLAEGARIAGMDRSNFRRLVRRVGIDVRSYRTSDKEKHRRSFSKKGKEEVMVHTLPSEEVIDIRDEYK